MRAGEEPFAWLESHPNWAKVGPKRKEIAALLAINELDEQTRVLSNLTNQRLAAKYPEYNEAQFKNTFAALRHRKASGTACTRETRPASDRDEVHASLRVKTVRPGRVVTTETSARVTLLSLTANGRRMED
jgi:hypothetical protein